MHSSNIFGAWMNHGQTRTHKTHHGPNLGEATTFPLIVLFLLGHRAYSQIPFCFRTPKLGILKFSKLGLPWLWKPIIFFTNLALMWDLKQSCSPRREIFNGMWHATCTQVNQGDFLFLVVGSQIGTLTPSPSFGHNLCFKTQMGHVRPFKKSTF